MKRAFWLEIGVIMILALNSQTSLGGSEQSHGDSRANGAQKGTASEICSELSQKLALLKQNLAASFSGDFFSNQKADLILELDRLSKMVTHERVLQSRDLENHAHDLQMAALMKKQHDLMNTLDQLEIDLQNHQKLAISMQQEMVETQGHANQLHCPGA